ncbi:glycerophosphodiester phosphodiesterase family protein [Nioella nitratireducens]|uniref:glycerophosphodiester phosphodiesterase family protein n=1 Tax=Nioella nitratireducens TaxID=1287720 RepID=UPI0008FD025A|nr:glycerophosphodiester phosphodiesterase family protein [Nioella nitratireducens]
MTAFPQLDAFRGGPGLVRVIGHRGARGVMPENTIEGFAFALSAGVTLLEFDVTLTRDRVPVITHNHSLAGYATRDDRDQWLDAEGPRIRDLTLTDLLKYDVGGVDARTTYGQRFHDQVLLTGIRVPCLADLLDLVLAPGHSDVHLLLELKSDPELRHDPVEREGFVAAVVSEVRRRGLEERTVMHSFDWDLLDECRQAAPTMPTSYLSQMPRTRSQPGEQIPGPIPPDMLSKGGSLPWRVAAAGGQLWCPHVHEVTADLVREAHDLGLIVAVWTVNDIDDIDRLIAAGVDGLVTDYPGRVQHRLRLHGAARLGGSV